MVDLEQVIRENDPMNRAEILGALEILVTHNVFGRLAHLNRNHLVDSRMDSEDDVALTKEIREVRQTNRVLLGLEASAKQLTEGK